MEARLNERRGCRSEGGMIERRWRYLRFDLI